MQYEGISKTQRPLFNADDSDLQIIARVLRDEPAALVANQLLKLKSIEESEVEGEKILETEKVYQEIKIQLSGVYQKYKPIFSILMIGNQPLRLTNYTQDDIRRAYKNQNVTFLGQLCKGIL